MKRELNENRGLSPIVCKLILITTTLAVVFSLTACAGNPAAGNPATTNCPDNNRVNQGFSFGRYGENQDVEILDYFYGIPNCPSFSNPEQYKSRGKSLQGESTIGPMRRAHKLYVKWRIKSTGKEYENTVDLRQRLPKDMTKHEVHFTIQGSQLYVYLITPERRPPDMPPNGPRATHYLKTLIIYPDQFN